MSEPTAARIILTREQMRKLARYETTFNEIYAYPSLDAVEFICPDVYTYTLDDLTEAVRNLKAADPTVYDFGEDWFYPITQLEEAFDLTRACGDLEDVDDRPGYLKKYYGLMVSDSAWFSDVWYDLDDAWSEYDDEEHLSEILNFDRMLADLDRYASNKGKPITEWVFSEQEMNYYVGQFEDDVRVKKASEPELALCRKMLEDLCATDYAMALRIKGYACYGGNRLYSCDWPTSRDCMLRLFEKTDDPQYANTLGYIFYYGRCTGGVPEYDKAFHYFEIAAANGLYEGMYKLADMYRHGYGCGKSPRTARALYSMVYDDSRKRFLEGDTNSFADAALRMGNVFAQGIDVKEDVQTAYAYYLQADYAAKIRAREDDFFGNTTVVMNIRQALEETRAKLPEDYFEETMDTVIPYLFSLLSANEHRCLLTREALENGDVQLTATRFATKSRPEPDSILITIGELNLCERVTVASMTALQPSEVWFRDDSDSVRFDYCTWSSADNRYEFYYDDELTAWIRCETYRITAPAPKAASGENYHFVSIQFHPGGRNYDYLCDLPDVKVGDTVVVNGYDGETEVTVTNVFSRYESELGIPIERFKRVVRKV